MVRHICLKKEMTVEYFYHDEMLLINATLPVARILEIIKAHMDLK